MTSASLRRWRNILLGVMLLSALGCVCMISLWIIVDDAFAEPVLIELLLLSAYSFTAMLCMNLLCRGRTRALMWIGVCASAAAMLAWQPVMIAEWMQRWGAWYELPAIVAGTWCSCVAGWCALFAGLHAVPARSLASQIVTIATLLTAAMTGILIMLAVLQPRVSDSFAGAIAIFSMLTGVGLLASLGLSFMSLVRNTGTGETLASKVMIALKCPRCASEQTVRAGLSRCEQCGLRLEINVEEPTCECGYQLYQLTSDACPECGRQIPETDRWSGVMREQPGVG